MKELLQQPEAGWEKRIQYLCKPEHFYVSVVPAAVLSSLTTEQIERLLPKLELVVKAAKYMASGMLKGVLKYPTDDIAVEQWMAHVIDEGADQMNYQMLLWNAWVKDQARRPPSSYCSPPSNQDAVPGVQDASLHAKCDCHRVDTASYEGQ